MDSSDDQSLNPGGHIGKKNGGMRLVGWMVVS